MRTTITLDDDIARKLQAQSRKTGKAFKDVVNETLRLGLTTQAKLQTTQIPPFKIKARPLGLKKGFSYDHVAELIEHAEGEGHR